MNEKGYTLIEAMFQLVVFVLISHFFCPYHAMVC